MTFFALNFCTFWIWTESRILYAVFFWYMTFGKKLMIQKLCFFFRFSRMKILYRLKAWFLLFLWLWAENSSGSALTWQPCPELSSALRYPCRCKVEPFGPKSQLGAVSMDCDNVVFPTESPILPNGAPIISFSQRHCGQQVLPTQVNQEIQRLQRKYISTTFSFWSPYLCRHMLRPDCLCVV